MKPWMGKIATVLLPVIVLAAAAGSVAVLFASAPQVERTAEKRLPPLVEVMEVMRGPVVRTVPAYGTVMPARAVEIFPEVSGRIVEVHPSLEPGGIIPAGDILIRIDPEEYELALSQAEGALAEAEAALEVEKGRQLVAKREWELFGKELPNAELGESLALREPQLRQAEARIASAQSIVDKAKLDLKRTVIKAPFDVLVLRESVDVGQLVGPGSSIASLAGADVFWVQVSIPVARLEAILEAAAQGLNAVKIYSDVEGAEDSCVFGKLIRHLGQVDPEGRMAQVLLEVKDPLGLQATETPHGPLVLNSYVRAELDAGILTDVVSIPRQALRENSEVWVADANDRLQLRHAEIVWRQGEQLAIKDVFEPGDRIVVSPVADLLPDMEVRLPAAETANPPGTAGISPT